MILESAIGMSRAALVFFCLAAAVHLSVPALAASCADETCESTSADRLYWSLGVDNDILTGTGNDYGYTGGLRFTLVGERTSRFSALNYRALNRLDKWTGVARFLAAPDAAANEDALQAGVILFTPEDLENGEPLPDDRPYANLLYFSHSHYVLNPQRDVMYQSTFTLGLLGSSLAEEVQGAIHSATGLLEPRGYANQISDGGELTARYAVARHSLLTESDRGPGSHDVKLTLEGSVGYLTEAAAALNLRWGRLGTPWWSTTSEYAEYGGQPAPRAIGRQDDRDGQFYFLAGAKLRARIYNVFLQGQFRDSSLTFSASELRPLVLDAWVGVARQVAGYHITYAVRHQTKEIRHGPAAKSLTWAGFTVSRDFR